MRTRSLCVFLFLCVLPEIAFGQVAVTGKIAGAVTDSSGAAVVNATVTVQSTALMNQRTTHPESDGGYLFDLLPPGTYEVTVTVPGFKRYTRGNLVVQVAAIVRADIALEVGATSEAVTVNEAAPLLKTESGELSHNVQTTTMDALPILGIGSSIAA